MTRERLRGLVDQYCDPTVEWRTANGIHCEIGHECERLSERKDSSAYCLLVDLILIDDGSKRNSSQIQQLFPVLYMLVGDRDGMRVADMIPEDFQGKGVAQNEDHDAIS